MENFNFGWAASGLTIILNILPIVSFINFHLKKTSFEKIPSTRIFTNYATCFCWFFYGSMLFNNLIRFTYMIGMVISLLFIVLYISIEFTKYLLDSILNSIIVILGSISFNDYFGHIILDDKIVGRICLFVSVASSLSKVPNIYSGFVQKNHLLIPVNYSVISFPAYFCWIIYGLIIDNIYILISNIIGITISIIQIFVVEIF